MRFPARVRLVGGLLSLADAASGASNWERLGGASTVIVSLRVPSEGGARLRNAPGDTPFMRIYRRIDLGQGHFVIDDANFVMPAPPRSPVTFVRASLAVLAKDLRIEVATREIVTTAGFFAALVAILTSVAFTTGAETTTRVAPGALWLSVAFASILALARSWQREREESALVGLLVSPIPRAA